MGKFFPVFFLLALISFPGFFNNLQATNAPDIQYILYARVDGSLGLDLGNYWRAVLPTDLCHQAISKYPPHCSLTGFFRPDPNLSVEDYLNAISTAIAQADNEHLRDVSINSSFQRGKQLDYIKITSVYFSILAEKYVGIFSLPSSLIKGPPGFTFHITLRDHVFKTPGKLERIQSLQSKYIHLHHSAGWLIYVYKNENGVLSPLGPPVRLLPSD